MDALIYFKIALTALVFSFFLVVFPPVIYGFDLNKANAKFLHIIGFLLIIGISIFLISASFAFTLVIWSF